MTGYEKCLDCKNFTGCEICELFEELPEEELLNCADNERGPRKDWTIFDFISECLHGLLHKCRRYLSRLIKAGEI